MSLIQKNYKRYLILIGFLVKIYITGQVINKRALQKCRVFFLFYFKISVAQLNI